MYTKWSYTLWKLCRKCCKILKKCMTILCTLRVIRLNQHSLLFTYTTYAMVAWFFYIHLTRSRHYTFSTYAQYSEKLSFLPRDMHTPWAYQWVRNVRFSSNFAHVLIEWSPNTCWWPKLPFTYLITTVCYLDVFSGFSSLFKCNFRFYSMVSNLPAAWHRVLPCTSFSLKRNISFETPTTSKTYCPVVH